MVKHSNRNVQQRPTHDMTILAASSTATATRKASFRGEHSPFCSLFACSEDRQHYIAWSARFLLRRGMSSDELSARGVHVVVLQHRRCRRRCRRRPWSSVVAARLAIALIGAGATTADARCGHALVHARIHSQVARMVRFPSLHLKFPSSRSFSYASGSLPRCGVCAIYPAHTHNLLRVGGHGGSSRHAITHPSIRARFP